jgi:hypothetical protein
MVSPLSFLIPSLPQYNPLLPSADPSHRLSEGTPTAEATPQQSTSNAAASSSSSGNNNSSAPPYKTTLQVIITVFMMGAAVMMACAGALGIKNANNVNDTGLVFIGLYMHIFAAILFCYEAIQIRPCDVLDTFYKRNFGFLYGPNGKGAYLIL